MSEKDKIRVAIVDDHQLFRDGIAGVLNTYPHCELSAAYANGRDFTAALNQIKNIPDVVLLDLQMPVMNGLETCKFLKQHHPEIKILMLSMSDEPRHISETMQNGASGYLTKNITPEELELAITTVFTKGYYLNDLTSAALLKYISPAQKDSAALNERELEFIKLCCSELTFAEIAKEMYMSVRTIEFYRANLYNKLKVKSRTGLVLYALRNKLVTLEDNGEI